MLFSTVGQAWIFLATLYGGVGVGALYDLGRIVRFALKAGRLANGIVDALFWCAAGGVMLGLLVYIDSGEIRAYMLLGFACGWGLYSLGISPFVMAIFRAVRRAMRKFAQTEFAKRLMK